MLGLGRNCNEKDLPPPPALKRGCEGVTRCPAPLYSDSFPCGRKPSLAPDLNSALCFSKPIPVLETISNRWLLSMNAGETQRRLDADEPVWVLWSAIVRLAGGAGSCRCQ